MINLTQHTGNTQIIFDKKEEVNLISLRYSEPRGRPENETDVLVLSRANIINRDVVESILEAKEDNWDGCGSLACSLESAEHARTYLENHYPLDLPIPTIGAEPNGRLGLEWVGEHGRLAAAFNANGSITFGGVNSFGKMFKGSDLGGLLPKIRELLY